MVAIITQDLKKQVIQSLLNDVEDSASRYYIGIGRSEDWDSSDTPPTPILSNREVRNARLGLQSIKTAETVSFVVPRNTWTSGTIYAGWDDNVAGHPTTPYYVVTDENAVYICLQQGKDNLGDPVTSTVKPTGTSTSAFTTSDGYVWKFLYTITALNASNFLTANFMPVRKVDATDSSSGALDIEQKGIQDSAIAGQISGINLLTSGSGYSSAPTVTIVGDGTGASASASLSGGEVVKIEMDNDSSALGSGYTYAEAVLSGGSPTTAATARPILSPPAGFGADPRDDLRARSIMFNSKPSGDEGGDFIITNDFRQVILMKGLKKPNDSDFTLGTGIALRSLSFSSVSSAFTADRTIEGASSGAQAYVDRYDAGNSLVYFHQTEETGFTSFTEGETVSETNGSGSGILDSAGVDGDSDADSSGDIDRFSGQILYIDNRASITRSADQTEDIKVIIQI